MTKGKWKYKKADGHHHVLMGDEVLDVNSENDARAISMVPELVRLVKYLQKNKLLEAWNLAFRLKKKLKRL